MASDLIECSNPQMLTKYFYILLFCSVCHVSWSQQLPIANIYHFTITKSGGKHHLKSPLYLSNFNSNGYNNQPSFFNDDLIYFSTNYYDIEQTEIAKFDLFNKELERITYSQESEYSPTPVPKKEEFSCVRVEKDGVTQALNTLPLDGIGYPKRYMHNTNNIGYHNWLNPSTLALFLVDEPHHNLAIAEAQSERRKIILDNIGRTLKVSSDGHLLFVHKISETEWYIKKYNINTNKSQTIVRTLVGSEDFEILVDGSYLMGAGSKIFKYDPKTLDKWIEIADLSEYNIKNISRISVRKNRLVLVDQSN